MAFPIIPRRRSGTAGNPTSLNLGELAVNTLDGELYLGGDGGVMLLNGPVSAGTTVTEHTGDGTTVAFTFSGYNGTEDGGYIVSVGGIDQPPSKYSITNTAGGTITFVEAPVSGELISIRAIVAGSGGDGNAIQIQGRDVASTAPTAGQVLAWNSTASQWQPTSLNGSVSFNTAGTHQWAVPAWVRWVYVNAAAGDGTNGTATNGENGAAGVSAYFDTENSTWVAPSQGANGADGTASAGAAGKSISIAALSLAYNGGAAGLAGVPGKGGGGGGGGASELSGFAALAGLPGTGTGAGQGGGAGTSTSSGTGGFAGGGTATDGTGNMGGSGGEFGGSGGNGGYAQYSGGGGGGGTASCGGGGGGGGYNIGSGDPGGPGSGGGGGAADTSMSAGGTGDTFDGAVDFSTVANTTIDIVISEGEGNASITITW